MANNNNNRNSYVAQEEQGLQIGNAMDRFKLEVAQEIGLHNYDKMDKGWLASRQNGYVGGNMTRKLVQYAEQVINQQGHETIMSVTGGDVDVSPEVRRLNEMASQNFNGFVGALTQGLGYGDLVNQQTTQQLQ